MKRTYFLCLTLLTFGLVILTTAFRKPAHPSDEIIENIKLEYFRGYSDLLKSVEELKVKAEGLSEESLQEVQKQFEVCRYHFKEIEFLMEYFDPEFVKLHINGAPLPRMSTDDNANKVEPIGFQTLEESLFGEEALEQTEAIQALLAELAGDLQTGQSSFKYKTLTHRNVIEAARHEIIRIVSLSLTGYDTPVRLAGIQESVASLKGLHKTFQDYYPGLNDLGQKDLVSQLDTTFLGAIDYLKNNPDFETFDHLHFLTHYGNPLYAQLYDLHRAFGFPTIDQTSPQGIQHATNYQARNIFSSELINPFYYSELVKADYSDQLVKLGQYLFYDPVLSKNLERSCASCHHPDKAFTDGLPKSLATGKDTSLQRNAPTLVNALYSPKLFLDLRTEAMHRQVQHVLVREDEFNTSFFEVYGRLKQSPEYVKMFEEAFPQYKGKYLFNNYTFGTAFSAYLIANSSFSSPFDKYVRGEQAEIEESVKRGYNIFMGKAGCGTCHFAPTFAGLVPPLFHEMESEILGVPANNDFENPVLDNDPGRVAGKIKDRAEFYHRSFKTVTARNSAKTGPYMHNGVYNTLEEVMKFYNLGGGAGMGMEVPHQTLPPDPLGLNDQEIQDLIAFMHALTNTQKVLGAPERLPEFPEESGFAKRNIGGEY